MLYRHLPSLPGFVAPLSTPLLKTSMLCGRMLLWGGLSGCWILVQSRKYCETWAASPHCCTEHSCTLGLKNPALGFSAWEQLLTQENTPRETLGRAARRTEDRTCWFLPVEVVFPLVRAGARKQRNVCKHSEEQQGAAAPYSRAQLQSKAEQGRFSPHTCSTSGPPGVHQSLPAQQISSKPPSRRYLCGSLGANISVLH